MQGEFAEHCKGHEADCFVSWHAIRGSITGFGYGDGPEKLKAWWLENPVLPLLSGSLGESMTEISCPCGVKILFGAYGIAEVRLNGDRHETASIALGELPWPRLIPPGFVRSFIMVLDRECRTVEIVKCDIKPGLGRSTPRPPCVYRTRCRHAGQCAEEAGGDRGKHSGGARFYRIAPNAHQA